MKKCPLCAEEIQDEAIVCRFCGRDLRAGAELPPKPRLWNPGIAALLSFLIPGAGSIYKGEVGFGIFWFFLTVLGYFFFVVPGLAFHLIGVWIAATGDPTKPGDAPPTPAAPKPEWKPEPMSRVTLWFLGVVIAAGVITIIWALFTTGRLGF